MELGKFECVNYAGDKKEKFHCLFKGKKSVKKYHTLFERARISEIVHSARDQNT